MKRIIILMMCLSGVLFANAQVSIGLLVSADSDWTSVQEQARKENKYILAYVYNTFYAPCVKMEDETFPKLTPQSVLGKKFITVRVQMDSTIRDSRYTVFWRNWLKKRQLITSNDRVKRYPAYLFYSSNGDLIYKDSGFKNPTSFLEMINFSLSKKVQYFKEDLEVYQKGRKNYARLPDLIKISRNLMDDEKLIASMVMDYKTNYLDKLIAVKAVTAENIKFIEENGGEGLLNVSDQFFYAAYNKPSSIDEVLGAGYANRYVNAVVDRLVIRPLLSNDNRLAADPNWEAIDSFVSSKYPKVNLDSLLLMNKLDFYRRTESWDKYTDLKTQHIKKYHPEKPFFDLNAPAWDVFEHCNNHPSLERALSWSELSIKLESSNVQYYDTKANLLYKLGRIQEAIACELQAIELTKLRPERDQYGKPYFLEDYKAVVEKMKRGEVTWTIKK